MAIANALRSSKRMMIFRPRIGHSVRPSLLRLLSTSDPTNPFVPLDKFAPRHLGPRDSDAEYMLEKIKCASLDDLIDKTIPDSIRYTDEKLIEEEGRSEQEALAEIRRYEQENKVHASFIGMGYHGTVTPSVILRNVAENPGWYTAYTPYQPEVSQGRLEMLLNFQTMIADLTGMEMANASLLDEATAAAESLSLCYGLGRGKKTKFFVSDDVHPQSIDLIKTRAIPLGVEVVVAPYSYLEDADLKPFAGAMLQYPNTYGSVDDLSHLGAKLKKAKCGFVVASDPLALTVLKSPGEFGADIVVGSAQRFGVPMFYGGPHAGFFACSGKMARKMPGRVIGVSKDAEGNPALRLAMQAREQHIRRDKATSNICTAQALLANMAAMYAIYHGPDGLKDIAVQVHNKAARTAAVLSAHGEDVEVATTHFFDTLRLSVPDARAKVAELADREINVRLIDDTSIGVSFDEATDMDKVVDLCEVFGVADAREALTNQSFDSSLSGVPPSLVRRSDFLTHPVFNKHHSETQMMRYLRQLEGKDIALNYGMIPLGSCTMKLNAASEMIPITWPGLANMHPFAPLDQTAGYQKIIGSLNDRLCKLTGFAAMSEQPNSGANGEFAGLLAIRSYHEANGDAHRNVCLIPVSAHGTNPASAVMAGMKVVVVKSDDEGNVDIKDLRAKAEKHADNLGALMITYPSTYGVFEEGVEEVIQVVHDNGGQVYMDGANMNAQVGYTGPGRIGADVCHLNLHKTFSIPHGGGGPGVGSIGVAKHLAPYLPGHAVVPVGGSGVNTVTKSDWSVSAAPFGSAGILPISWMYIRMMGGEGLRKSTQTAILNANYMAKRLEKHYAIKFRGTHGYCAHEFIIDARSFKESAGVTEEDIAKRLIDYGFHAPTMSWPVPGTLMIEPTESEDLEELDRLVDALISIRREIDEIANENQPRDNNVMVNAPHTQHMVTATEWDHPYTREQAAYPSEEMRHNKFWPSVARVDNVHGDRNLVCTCPPLESYEEE